MTDAQVCAECGRSFAWGRDSDSAIVEARGASWVSCAENAHWKLTFHMEAEHPNAGFSCPRRGESFQKPGNDWWGNRDGHKACSFCGSMSPDELFAAIEAGAELGPTDKNYKVYVDLPHPDVGKPCILSSANFEQKGEGWIQITAENRASLPLDNYQRSHFKDGHWVQVTARGPMAHAKFYFQHFSIEDRKRFIDLLNAKKINIGSPGYFYRLPFFCAPVEKAPAHSALPSVTA
jgi:hypothetical protein